jgi:hypothetical protein
MAGWQPVVLGGESALLSSSRWGPRWRLAREDMATESITVQFNYIDTGMDTR